MQVLNKINFIKIKPKVNINTNILKDSIEFENDIITPINEKWNIE